MWLRQFLALPNGIASHDTFGQVFKRLDAEAFQAAFLRWVQRAAAPVPDNTTPIRLAQEYEL